MGIHRWQASSFLESFRLEEEGMSELEQAMKAFFEEHPEFYTELGEQAFRAGWYAAYPIYKEASDEQANS
jgi:hypothetical protein